VPAIAPIQALPDLVTREGQLAGRLEIILAEQEGIPLKEALQNQPPSPVMLLVGPEGGWSDGDLALAKSNGFRSVSLGKRILRTETAGLAALAIVQYAWGDLGLLR
jgi:16S rRNA (uracil1498-N3)-methyltransferase